MLLSTLCKAIGAQLIGADAEFGRVSTDSRTIAAGDFFVALQGENFDGHNYLSVVQQAGAVAAMVSTPRDLAIAQVVVADTRLGLGQLAQAWLQQYQPRKIAITGSCGKTTVKEMVAAICARMGPTLFTQGNLNNDIGVPLTLCRITAEHEYAIIEMGANHGGEIAYTVSLVHPHAALVNNVGAAHLEGFGSIEQVAQAKSEIYQGLDSNGVAVVNLDDGFADLFLERTSHCQRITYSMHNTGADVVLLAEQMNAAGQYQVEVAVKGQRLQLQLGLIGRHNVANALAAIALAHAVGCSAEAMSTGLATLKAVPGRLRVVEELPGFKVIDDTYNANPTSICAAIDVLAALGGDNCLVLGGMAELGVESATLHRKVGAYAAAQGITTVYGVGEQAALYREGYLAGNGAGVFITAENHQRLAEDLFNNHKNKTILIKGSRSAAMEKVIARMVECYQATGGNN